jgi:large subunit ribosomal protein L13
MNKTTFITKEDNKYDWFLIDANSATLGRLSTEISRILLGKNNPHYNPSQNIHQGVIIINGKKRPTSFIIDTQVPQEA